MEPSHVAWLRAPMIAALPSCQSPSKNVQVLENPAGLNGTIVDPGCDRRSSRMALTSMVCDPLPEITLQFDSRFARAARAVVQSLPSPLVGEGMTVVQHSP